MVGQPPTPHVTQPKKWWNKYKYNCTYSTILALINKTNCRCKNKQTKKTTTTKTFRCAINKSEWKRQKKSLQMKKKERKNSGKISLKTSRLKWWLQETPPTNLCPVRSVWDVSLRYPCWNCADIDLLPQHMHAEILPTGTPPTNQYPVYYTVCFSHESRSHRDLPQQTYAQYIILYRMFLLHIQAEIVPTRISFHKPVSNTFSKGCFSSMSRLKWCLLQMVPTSNSHKLMPTPLSLFLLYIQAEIVLTGNYSHKPMLSMLCRMFLLHIQAQTLSRRCFSYNPSWNGACGELLQLTKPLTANPRPVCSSWEVSLTHPGSNGAYGKLSQKSMPAYGELSHKPMPSTISKGHFS